MVSGSNARIALHKEAAAHCAAGRLSEAETAYRRLLADNPDDDDALHGLGVIALAMRQTGAAVKLLERAVRLQPTNPVFLDKLGVALALSGHTAEAGDAFRQAVDLQPGNVDARFNLGLWLLNAGANEEALVQFEHVVKARPRHPMAWLNKGIAHARCNQTEDGRECLARARALAPDDTNVRLNYASVLKQSGELENAEAEYRAILRSEPHNILALFNLAVTLKDMGRQDEALEAYQRVLTLDPEHLDSINNVGVIRLEQGHPDEAIVHFERVLRDRPNDGATLCNKATALQELDRPDEALALLNSLCELAPDDVATASARAHAIMQLGDLERADTAFAEILARAPNEPKSLYGRALCRLRSRDFARGFELFEHRWAWTGEAKRALSIPEWAGPHQAGSLLVWKDQGIGDQILFAGVLPHLAERKVEFTFECDERLVPLLRRSFPNFAINAPLSGTASSGHGFSAHLPAGSLMHRLKLWSADAAPRTRYLESDRVLLRSLDTQLASLGRGPRIGISWRSARRIVGTHKSLPLDLWQPILRNRDAVFVNLQYGETEEEIASAQAATGAVIYTEPSIDRFADIDALAALIDSLDLVITTSNVTAHIAGGLGKECWLALQRVPLWYWTISGDVPHIYASIRTFRQRTVGDWTPVVADLVSSLDGWLAEWERANRP